MTKKSKTINWNVARIFELCGGARGMCKILDDAGLPTKLAKVRAWWFRRSIPAGPLATILMALRDANKIKQFTEVLK